MNQFLHGMVRATAESFDLPEPRRQVDKDFGAQLAMFGGAPVVLAQPVGAESWVGARIAKFGEGPCAFILGATRPGRYRPASESRWFGFDVSWFDPEKLGARSLAEIVRYAFRVGLID